MLSENEKLPKAIDLSHHLTEVSKSRETSPLKGLARYFGKPGIISLAGGMPSPVYFPVASLSAETLAFDSFATTPSVSSESNVSWFWRLFSKGERTEHMTIPKYSTSSPQDSVSLEIALQY